MINEESRRVKCSHFFTRVVFIVTLILIWDLELGVRAEPRSLYYLRIRDWKTGEVYASSPVKAGSTLFFGWIHSLEKFPWNEYYHISDDYAFVLDAITFPAFGAGVPENKGRVCYIENGLIHMEGIGQEFKELVWLNSHTATQEIKLDEVIVTRGNELPHHSRLRMAVEEEMTKERS